MMLSKEEEIILSYPVVGVRDRMREIGLSQVEGRGKLGLIAPDDDTCLEYYYRCRLASYIGLSEAYKSCRKGRDKGINLIEDYRQFKRMLIDVDGHATVHQILAAWLTTDDWRWEKEQSVCSAKELEGYGLVSRFYTPIMRMGCYLAGWTEEKERGLLDPSWDGEARAFAEKMRLTAAKRRKRVEDTKKQVVDF